MLADAYVQKRRCYGGGFVVTKSLTAAATTADIAIPAVRTGKLIFVQRIRVHIQTGSAGKTLGLASSSGVAATVLLTALALDTASGVFTAADFGPAGIPMTTGELIKATLSAAGAAVTIIIEGYWK